MASSTSSGIVTSSLRTSAETSRPSIIAVKDSRATASGDLDQGRHQHALAAGRVEVDADQGDQGQHDGLHAR